MIHDVQFDDFAFQQAQRPFRAAFGRCREQAKAMSRASFSPSKMRGTGGVARCLRFNTASMPPCANCCRTRAHIIGCGPGFGNFWIVPLRPQRAFIGLQEYPRLKLFLGLVSCLSGSALRASCVRPRSVPQHSASCILPPSLRIATKANHLFHTIWLTQTTSKEMPPGQAGLAGLVGLGGRKSIAR